jgi:glycosyltransferase involved in cell wall biosynthesis
MRVLLDVSAVPDRPVGAGVYTIELARRLALRSDVELTLLSRSGDRTRWESSGATDVCDDVPDRRPLRLAWEQLAGPRHAARLGVDVWHGPHYTMPSRVTCPAIVTVHDMTFFDTPETHERAKVSYFRHAIHSSARRAGALICVSRHTAERLAALVPHHAPVTIAHHGVDHDRFTADADPVDDDALLARHGIVPPYVAFLGTAEPRKNLPGLVGAFAAVAADRPDLRLVLAGGDGWGTTELRAAIQTHRVATRIVRPGYLPDATVAAFYRRAAVVAYPSLAEGFGLPALEALACGAPLVTARGTAMDEFVGDAALRVDVRDLGALAAALRAALEPEVAARLRQAGPVQAAPFTWDRSVELHVETYRQVLERVAVA